MNNIQLTLNVKNHQNLGLIAIDAINTFHDKNMKDGYLDIINSGIFVKPESDIVIIQADANELAYPQEPENNLLVSQIINAKKNGQLSKLQICLHFENETAAHNIEIEIVGLSIRDENGHTEDFAPNILELFYDEAFSPL